jgi:hypothetical protein
MADDLLGQTFDDGRLAHARFSDQHRVVLRSPGQDLDDPFDLLLAPDDGVELGLTGELGEVAGELVEHGCLRALLGSGIVLIAEQGEGLLAHLVQSGAERFEDLGRDGLPFLHEAEQEMLRADVVVAELARFLDGELEHPLGLRGERDFTERERLGKASQGALDFGLDRFQPESETLQHRRRDALTVPNQPEKDMLRSHEIVTKPASFLACQDDDPSGAFGESLKHWLSPTPSLYRLRPIFLSKTPS